MPVSLFGKRKPPLLVMLISDSKADLSPGAMCACISWLDFPLLQGGIFHSVSKAYLGLADNTEKQTQATESLLTGSKSSTEKLRRFCVSNWSVMTDHLVSTT